MTQGTGTNTTNGENEIPGCKVDEGSTEVAGYQVHLRLIHLSGDGIFQKYIISTTEEDDQEW